MSSAQIQAAQCTKFPPPKKKPFRLQNPNFWHKILDLIYSKERRVIDCIKPRFFCFFPCSFSQAPPFPGKGQLLQLSTHPHHSAPGFGLGTTPAEICSEQSLTNCPQAFLWVLLGSRNAGRWSLDVLNEALIGRGRNLLFSKSFSPWAGQAGTCWEQRGGKADV